MAHSYEEIRDAVVEILLGKVPPGTSVQQFASLVQAVNVHFGPKNMPPQLQANLTSADRELVRDVFWDLFRQGHITLGFNNSNENWPFFRLSHFGKKALLEGTPYKFTDTETYLNMVRKAAPNIDEVTLVYLDEAVRDFYAGCFLSCAVMLGVAAENLFNRLLDVIAENEVFANSFAKAASERFMLRKISQFQTALEPLKDDLPRRTRENIDTHFSTIQAVIRVHRNDTGHPTGRALDRQQTYVNLQLFVPFAQKLEELESFFAAEGDDLPEEATIE